MLLFLAVLVIVIGFVVILVFALILDFVLRKFSIKLWTYVI